MTKVKESIRTPRPARTRKPCKGQQVGYVRVSLPTKPSARMRGPQLGAMQSFVREGDTLLCHSMDRRARNLDHLRRIAQGLTERGVHVVFVKENLTFTGEDSIS